MVGMLMPFRRVALVTAIGFILPLSIYCWNSL